MDSKKRIQIGMVYSAKVGGSWLPVKIEKTLGHGRYEGSAHNGQKVKVASGAIRGEGQTIEQYEASRQPQQHDLPTPPAEVTPKQAKKPKADKTRKPSGLDSAVRVLAEAGAPMNCGDMVKTMLEKGYWQTGGKTPAATIYAAIITEIAKKGDNSRFRKTDRGHFELTPAGIAARTAAGKETK